MAFILMRTSACHRRTFWYEMGTYLFKAAQALHWLPHVGIVNHSSRGESLGLRVLLRAGVRLGAMLATVRHVQCSVAISCDRENGMMREKPPHKVHLCASQLRRDEFVVSLKAQKASTSRVLPEFCLGGVRTVPHTHRKRTLQLRPRRMRGLHLRARQPAHDGDAAPPSQAPPWSRLFCPALGRDAAAGVRSTRGASWCPVHEAVANRFFPPRRDQC